MVTKPGFHPDTDFNSYPGALSLAIRAIGKSFYVTRSFDQVGIGNSNYWGLLARPANDFSVHLNVDRELLFVFSNYKDFEIRTLEAFDAFYTQLEQKRIDRSIRFLISNDKMIESVIHRYLMQNPEYPIIVPVYLPRVGGSPDEFLASVRRNYLLRDLFGYQNPLREETFFFGRQEQINSVLDLAKSGQSSSIFGLRKSGKTSAIYAIIRKARSFDFTPLFIDCQNPAVHARRYGELLSYVVAETRTAIGQNKRLPLLNGTDSEISEVFRSQFKTAVSQAKTRILLIFDEIENVTPGTAASAHWSTGNDCLLFWQNIRSFVQQDASGKVAVCLVGTSPLLLETAKINDVANPMYLFSQKRFIPAFTFDETQEMVERLGFFMGIELDATQIARLHKNYGGHPFFIRQVCSNIHRIIGQNRPTKVSDRQVEEAIEEFGGQLDAYLQETLGGLSKDYPDEFDLLKAVVLGDGSEIAEYGREAPELIDHLIGYGLVERRGDSVDIRFDAVRHALSRMFRVKSGEDMWSECMVRRNRVEVDVRRELFVMSKGMNDTEWLLLLANGLSRSRFANLKSTEPRHLFSRTESTLYRSDLISLIKVESVFSYVGDRKSAVLAAMNTVNSLGRKDSHANEFTDGEFEEISKALSVLEDEFQQPV